MARLSRQESQARTRACLIAAAGRVLARKGIQRASIDEVADEAGYTKGAFYANFKSKEELFLAMLDERFAEKIETIERLLATDEPFEARARAIGLDFDRMFMADLEWQRLFFEFAVHAARDPEFREELVTRHRALRERITELHRRRAEAAGVPDAVDLDATTLMMVAMAHGAALEHLLDPEHAPDDLYGRMLEIFATGLRAMAEVPSKA